HGRRCARVNAMLRLLGWLLAVALVALPLVAVLNGWVGSDHWPLAKLRATGQFHRVDDALLRQTLLPYARQGFFAVRLDDAQAAVAKLPWVERAEVRKRWPDVLEVNVVEHVPFARWGKDQVLSEHGRICAAAGLEVPAGRPVLHGAERRVDAVLELYSGGQVVCAPIGVGGEAVVVDAQG